MNEIDYSKYWQYELALQMMDDVNDSCNACSCNLYDVEADKKDDVAVREAVKLANEAEDAGSTNKAFRVWSKIPLCAVPTEKMYLLALHYLREYLYISKGASDNVVGAWAPAILHRTGYFCLYARELHKRRKAGDAFMRDRDYLIENYYFYIRLTVYGRFGLMDSYKKEDWEELVNLFLDVPNEAIFKEVFFRLVLLCCLYGSRIGDEAKGEALFDNYPKVRQLVYSYYLAEKAEQKSRNEPIPDSVRELLKPLILYYYRNEDWVHALELIKGAGFEKGAEQTFLKLHNSAILMSKQRRAIFAAAFFMSSCIGLFSLWLRIMGGAQWLQETCCEKMGPPGTIVVTLCLMYFVVRGIRSIHPRARVWVMLRRLWWILFICIMPFVSMYCIFVAGLIYFAATMIFYPRYRNWV